MKTFASIIWFSIDFPLLFIDSTFHIFISNLFLLFQPGLFFSIGVTVLLIFILYTLKATEVFFMCLDIIFNLFKLNKLINNVYM